MNKILAIFIKQIKDTLKNKTILIQLVMLPVMTVIMENTVKLENMPEHFFTALFSVMFTGMAPLTCMSAIISEEKEKGTLRVVLASGVSPVQYFAGVGLYVWLSCMVGAIVFAACGGYQGIELLLFLSVMGGGIIISMLLGAVIGVWCGSQMSATSVAIPVMSVFSFLPMLSMFNESIRKIAEITYSRQMSLIIDGIGSSYPDSTSLVVIALNLLVFVFLFLAAYKKKGLE